MTLENQNNAMALITAAQQLRFELVELYVDNANSGKSKFSFPTNNNLQGKRVLFIDSYSDDIIPTTNSGNAVVTPSIFNRAYLTLYTMTIDRQNLEAIPLGSLNVLNVPAGTTPFAQTRVFLNNGQTDWNKCYVTTGGAIGVGNVSFLFGVWYVDR